MLVIPQGQTPAAEGNLGQTPLLHLLVYLLDKSLSGTMVLTPPSGPRVGFYVDEGCPTRAQSANGKQAEDRAALEKALVELCLLPGETRYGFYAREDFLAGTCPAIARAEPLAKIMSAARACVGSDFAASTLRKVKRAQSIHLATNAAPERFRLMPEERALVERLRKHAMTFAELVSSTGVPEQVAQGVIYGLTITRHLDFGVPARPPVGVGILSTSAKQPPAPTTTATTSSVEISGITAAFTPAKTGTTGANPVEPPAARMRLESIPEVHDAPPSSKMPVSYRVLESVPADKRRAELEAKIAAGANENHFELLGLAPSATVLEIRDAYFGMAKIFHPDRLFEFPDLRPDAQAHFARITVAYNELSDDKKRANYIAKLNAIAPTERGTPSAKPLSDKEEQQVVDRAINASFEAQKAEVFLKKNDLAQAETHAALAAKADPDQPSYATLLAWIRAQQRPAPPIEEGHTTNVYDDLIAELDRVLKKEPNYEKAIFYRAVLLQRSGHADRALKDFVRSLELNPRNIDAAREVRLAKLRGKDKPDEPAPTSANSGGLFGKLFKR